MASRDRVAPELDTQLLEAIVDAEIESAGDGEVAMRAIDAAVTASISRGVGQVQEVDQTNATEDDRKSDGNDEGGDKA